MTGGSRWEMQDHLMNSGCFRGGDNLLWVRLSEPADIFSNGAIEQLVSCR